MNDHPVRLVIQDDLERNRITVLFRLLLVIPHLIWVGLWGVVALVAGLVNWVATLVAGQPPEPLHRFLSAYVRYVIHVNAYLFLAGNPFPGFLGRPGTYPIDVELPPPLPQNRWKTFFRVPLTLPAAVIAASLFGYGGARYGGVSYAAGVAGLGSTFGWFAALVRARMPRGLRDAIAYGLSYSAQLDAYLFLLTDRYPNSDPIAAVGPVEAPPHPIEMTIGDDLVRSRLTVFFRLLLAIPHLIWLELWGIVAFLAAIVNWFATLFTGRSPAGLHRFLSAFIRYWVHVYAFVYLVANPFPGFTGKPGTYPVEVTIGPPERQNRWVTGFRLILALPAMMLAGAYVNLAFAAAFLGWFVGLFTARMSTGLRNAGAVGMRYAAQAYGYFFLLTDRYPYTGPGNERFAGLAPPPVDAPPRVDAPPPVDAPAPTDAPAPVDAPAPAPAPREAPRVDAPPPDAPST